MDWGHLLFGFSGRINRAKWWLWMLLYVIVVILLGVIGYVVGSPMVTGILNFVVGIVVFITALAVLTKRLHDRGKSAWWLLIIFILPAVLMLAGLGVMLGALFGGDEPSMNPIGIILFLVALAIYIWAFVEVGCLRGTIGPNPYGPDPLEGRV